MSYDQDAIRDAHFRALGAVILGIFMAGVLIGAGIMIGYYLFDGNL